MKIEKFNESHIRIFAPSDVQNGIKDFFTFKAPGYRWNPRFKAKLWDGNISLYNLQTNKLPLGLMELLCSYAEKIDEPIEFIENPKYTSLLPDEIVYDDLLQFIDSLQISNGAGERITPKEYQIEAVYEALTNRRLTLSMPTGSGKSLTIYIIMRWMIANDKRMCLLVPSVSLVKQMISDFIEYSSINGFDVDEAATMLYSGQERDFTKPLLVSTWQTISKLVKLSHGTQALNSYDAIVVDESHTAKGAELQKILERASEVPYKIGTTGTIDKEKVNELTIIGSLGPIRKIVTTRELMDSNDLSSLTIKGMILQYDEETSKAAKGFDYQTEMEFICGNAKRNKTITGLALATTGTTMILCNYIDKHLIPLYEMISEKAKKVGRPVYMIHGGINPDERERIRKIAMVEDAILVCSFATCQQGLNVPKIDTVIFASPSKSSIRVLQSIGRGLRKALNKNGMTLVDIVDDMRYKKHENTLFQHFLERLKIYRVEQFDVELKEYKL